jgi:dTMP kinase
VLNLKKGILIVFEGVDGGGKTTQAKLLRKTLEDKGIAVVYFREPSDSRWGRIIREKAAEEDSLTPQEELELFVKDRRENVAYNLVPALAAHKVVLLDRYYFSTMAYQGAKGIDPEMIREMNESFAVIPDLVFVLDVEPDLGLDRIQDRKQRDLLFEREGYLREVRRLFHSFQWDFVFHIDAERALDEVEADISQITLDYIDFFVAECVSNLGS